MAQSVTLGTMVAGLLQFVVVMTLILPAAGGCINPTTQKNVCALSQGFNSTYFGTTNGLIFQTHTILNNSVLENTSKQAASSSGIAASTQNPQFTIGGFLYSGISSFFIDMLNIVPMVNNIFATTLSGIQAFDYAALSGLIIISGAIATYVSWLIAAKFIGMIQKVIVEEL